MSLMNDPVDIARFVTAGNAIFTLSSQKTGARYTFRAQKSRKRDGDFFVSVLTGPDNGADYTYFGMLAGDRFRTTANAKLPPTEKPVLAFRFFCDKVLAEKQQPDASRLEFRHEGRCGRCRRLLTVPESLDTGLGPECAAMMGITYGKK